MLDNSDQALRMLADLAQDYRTWLSDSRQFEPARLTWKSRGEQDYLYSVRRTAPYAETSIGPRSPETEAKFDLYNQAVQRLPVIEQRLAVHCAAYRQLQLPMLPAFAGEALRNLDVAKQLGRDGVLVVGTNAMIAYAIEATEIFSTLLTTTQDFDVTWVRSEPFPRTQERPVFDALKRGDSSWTVNSERTFQALNSNGDEFELLLPETLKDSFPRTTGLRPIPLPEQDWLIPGRYVEHVVACYDRKAARIIAPDPRWFALHKLWLSDKPQRDVLKKPKDRAQGREVLALVRDSMPHYPLDEDFAKTLPPELASYFDAWRGETSLSR